MEPRIQYVKTEDGVSIAYWTMGEGGTPLLISPLQGYSNIARECQIRRLFAWYQHLAEKRMIVRFDPRGEGMSQRELEGETLSVFDIAVDMYAICQHMDFDRVNVLAITGHCMPATVLAAEHPQLGERLIMWAPSHGADFRGERLTAVLALAKSDWEVFTETWANIYLGWSGGHRARAYASFLRESVSQDVPQE